MADPAFRGFVESTQDALLIFEGCRRDVLPKITRRLQEFEKRALVVSGAVFVFSEEETGIKRWTDGLSWSPSRTLGNFLVSSLSLCSRGRQVAPFRSHVSSCTRVLRCIGSSTRRVRASQVPRTINLRPEASILSTKRRSPSLRRRRRRNPSRVGLGGGA